MQNINKKNLYKLLFIIIILGFIVSLVGCNWLSLGLLNVFDPQAQIRVDYKLDGVTTQGTADISFGIFSLNEAEFIGTGFLFEYYNEGVKITDPELSRMVGATFYVPPYPLSSFEKPVSIEFPLYFQDVLDYMTLHPLIVEITSTITVIGTDSADHDISKTITFDLPTILPGIDFEPPSAVITATPGTTGTAPFTVVFDASSSTDNRGIASYTWDFGDGTTGTGVMPESHTYSSCGTYIVNLTVTDFWGNEGYTTEIITVGETGGPKVDIQVTPSLIGNEPFTVYFDASDTEFETECGMGTSTYNWNFGDGSTAANGVTIFHTFTSNGVYTVILTVTDSAGNVGYGSVTITVELSGAVEAVIETTPLSATGTKPFTIALDASESTTSASGATIATYKWDYDFGAPLTETLTIPVTTHTYTLEGTYLVQLTVTDSLGNVDYEFVSIVVTIP